MRFKKLGGTGMGKVKELLSYVEAIKMLNMSCAEGKKMVNGSFV
jgi:hypothetical protein